MDKAPPSEIDVLLRCLRDGLINDAQAKQARAEADRWRHAGSMVSMPTLLYGLGFIDRTRALALEESGSVAAPPEHVGNYAVLERLGSGGMGEVYRAVDIAGRIVALKLLPKQMHMNVEFDRRFQREARLTRMLKNPHIVRTLDSGKDGSYRWLAMDLVPGPTLKQRMQAGYRLSEIEGLMLFAHIASAMQTAAKSGILHRDIKPSNIILASPRYGRNEPFCAKLCDFGLGKMWTSLTSDPHGSASGTLTAHGMSLGTPHYMSPEQARGEKNLDQRTDIYALGAVLFHCLTGSTVHTGEDSQTIMTQQVGGIIDFQRLIENDVSDHLSALIQRMLAKECNQRPVDWETLIRDLHAVVPPTLIPPERDPLPQSIRTNFSHIFGFIGQVVVVMAVFIAIGSAMWWIFHG